MAKDSLNDRIALDQFEEMVLTFDLNKQDAMFIIGAPLPLADVHRRLEEDIELMQSFEELCLGLLSPSAAQTSKLSDVRNRFLKCIAENKCATLERLFPPEKYSADIQRYMFAPPALKIRNPEALFEMIATNLISKGLAARASATTIHR